MSDFVRMMHDRRNRAHSAAREIAERARLERRIMTGAEQQGYERANAEITECDAQIRDWREDALRRANADHARRGVEHIVRPEVSYGPDGLGEDALGRFLNNGRATRQGGNFEVDFSPYKLTAPGGVPRVEARGLGGYVGAPLILVIQRPDGVEYRRSSVADQGAGGYSLTVPIVA